MKVVQVLLFLLASCGLCTSDKCHDMSGLKKGDSCHQHWGKLKWRMHPTQPQLGYSWALQKHSEHMGSEAAAQDELDEKPIPVCLGPANDAWLLDHHHLLAALDYSGYFDVSVTINVVCVFDPSMDMQTFWKKMVDEKGVFNYASPDPATDALYKEIDFTALPNVIFFNTTASSLINDNWRSLAGFGRKLSSDSCAVKYCDRTFIKTCDSDGDSIPFFEFRWGYFFNQAFLEPEKLWNGDMDAFRNFSKVYNNLKGLIGIPGARDRSTVDLPAWTEAARLLLPVARGNSAGTYTLQGSAPAVLYGKLPGYHRGMGPIDGRDPSCNPPRCRVDAYL
eukprot:g1647.t1